MNALALPLIPLLGAIAVVAARRHASSLGPIAIATMLLTLSAAGWAATAESSFSWNWSAQLELSVTVEGFGRVMVILVPLIAVPILTYAAVIEERDRVRLLSLMLAFVGTMLLLVIAADFLTLLIAWELIGAMPWALIGTGWLVQENSGSAAYALIATQIGDLALYIAAGLTFAASGSFAFADLSAAEGRTLDLIAAGVLVAAAAKPAQVIFAHWLFRAMAGPTLVSRLHSATLVASAAYLLIRMAPALESSGWFLPAVAAVGLASVLAGGALAMIGPPPRVPLS
jgi:NADH-quinone oxidoreductase subunit L